MLLQLYQKAVDAAWISSLDAAYFFGCSYFPSQFLTNPIVSEFVAATHALVCTCAILCVAWPLACHFGLCVSSKFRSLSSYRHGYVIANISKAVCLAVMCLNVRFFTDLYRCFYNNEFARGDASDTDLAASVSSSLWIKRTCALYVSTDLVALLLVSHLPRSTFIHHCVSGLLAFIVFGTDLENANVARMIALYGAFSSLAFLVNLFLALRCMYDDARWMRGFAKISLCVYVVSCACNWFWHACWLLMSQTWVSEASAHETDAFPALRNGSVGVYNSVANNLHSLMRGVSVTMPETAGALNGSETFATQVFTAVSHFDLIFEKIATRVFTACFNLDFIRATSVVLYMFAVCAIGYDDIVLMRWLYSRSRREH